MSTFSMPVVDRSRFSVSWGRCQRARFLNYHSVNGFGVARKQKSLPLATGISVHKILEGLITLGEPATRQQQREVILAEVKKYTEDAKKSGVFQLAGETNQEESVAALEAIVKEQASLIEGLAWAAVRCFLPKLWREFTVVAIEQEEEYVLQCSCGLGEGAGSADEHEARECDGIVLMSRPDLILRENATEKLCYVEFKTSGDVANYNWREQFEDNVQLALGVAGAEKRLGEEIPQCYVVGFNKGWRKKGYDSDTQEYSGPKTQDSIFCYAWKKEANPPNWEEDWKTKFKYFNPETGKNTTLKGKGYEKALVGGAEFPGKPVEQSVLEYWTFFLDEEDVQKEIVWLGPLPATRYLVKDLLEALGHAEREWQEKLWGIWEAKQKGEEEYNAALNKYVPQSWECHRWGKKCSYLSVCRKDSQLVQDDGVLNPEFVFRKPHHEREVAIMTRLGIPVPNENGEFDEAE